MIISTREISKISVTLRKGGVIAFPTDTVWGVGCLVKKQQAVEKIYHIKAREKTKPLILLGSSLESFLPYIETLPSKAEELTERFFPGALTIVLKKSVKTPDYLTSGYETIGIRIPDHPVFIEMLEKAVEGHVLATTSANISGQGAVSGKEKIQASLVDKIDYILNDYGFPAGGEESTVVHVDSNNKIEVLRQGAVIL
jgi:L-threonylcarbamoyladenylate synthase